MVKTNEYQDPRIVIIDYGLAQTFMSDRAQICGTPGYIPPETWMSRKWYPKGDCFSLGVVMLQLVSGNVPCEKESKMGIFVAGAQSLQDVANITCTRPTPLELVGPGFLDLQGLLSRVLQKEQSRRINAVQVFQLPWMGRGDISDPSTRPLSLVTIGERRGLEQPSRPNVGAPCQQPWAHASPPSTGPQQQPLYVQPAPLQLQPQQRQQAQPQVCGSCQGLSQQAFVSSGPCGCSSSAQSSLPAESSLEGKLQELRRLRQRPFP